MHPAVSPVSEIFGRDSCVEGVVVADGYGIQLRVERGHLVVEDGIGRHRRERRFARATHGLRRVLVLGHTGYITFEAQRWMADVGVDYVHLETDGRILATSTRRVVDHPALRRAQALAAGTDVGLTIIRELLDAKLGGQARVAASVEAAAVASEIDDLRRTLARAPDRDACRSMEAKAAAAYWRDAWAPVPVRFVRRDAAKVPDNWKSVGGRQSSFATVSSPRRATNPANALLNYLYALGEAETRLALVAVGLDPGLGFLHVDQRPRHSAALDVLEAIRPDIDGHVLTLIQERTWSRRDFAELSDGTCRLLPPVTHELADTMRAWGRLVAPIVERVTALLTDAHTRLGPVATPLTQANRSAGRRSQRKRPARAQKPRVGKPRATCQTCGCVVARDRTVCDQCLREYRRDARTIGRRGQEGIDPDPQLLADREIRREATKRWAQSTASEQRDPREFDRNIRVGLGRVPTKIIRTATGLSRSYCIRIRNGSATPHPRHWEALRRLVDSADEPASP